jgi:hypothetical protein
VTVTHRMSRTRTHKSWTKMRERCRNPNAWQYKYYGGRGVKVCKRWDKFENFLADMTDGNYTPANCRWADAKAQARGQKKTILIRGKSLREICERRGLIFGRAYHRYRKGMPIKAVLYDGPLYPWPWAKPPAKENMRHQLNVRTHGESE